MARELMVSGLVNEAEREAIVAAADEVGLSVSTFVRRSCLAEVADVTARMRERDRDAEVREERKGTATR